jgi:hypothetical protein
MFPLLNARVVPAQVLAQVPAQVPAQEGQRNRRKCSHCREEGHTINQCPTLDATIEDLYYTALTQVQQDVNTRQGGYAFESWICSLSNREMQYLVWKCQNPEAARGRHTNILRRISDVESRNILFEHFHSLDLGYVTKSVRLARHYYQAYRAVQSDVANGQNGAEFQHYLTHLIPSCDQRDIYAKILESRGLRDSPIEEREFNILWAQWDRRPGSVLTNQEFIIHAHFAGIAALGYDFRVRNMPDYQVPIPPQPRVVRVGQAIPPRNYRREELAVSIVPIVAQPYRDSLYIRFLKNQSITLNFRKDGPYPVSYLRDYKIIQEEEEDADVSIIMEEDCPICLETKTPAHFLKMGCTHGFCNTCVGKIIATAIPKLQEVHCPLCRDELREIHYSDFSKVKTMFRKGEETA